MANESRSIYRSLNDEEQVILLTLKNLGQELINQIKAINPNRETDIAIMKTEEAIMWAVKGLTA